MLTGRYRLSRREAQQLLSDLWGVKISLGALSCLEESTSRALEPVVKEIRSAIRGADALNMDETGWKENSSRVWLWTAVAQDMSLFHIDASRGGKVVEDLLGEDFAGVVGTDRYSAYNRIPVEQRALCYAHLKRNFQALVDRGADGACIGRWGLAEVGRLFGLWHKYREGELDRHGLQTKLRPLRARFGRLLEHGRWSGDSKAEALCWGLSELWEALWSFAEVEGVEPTNPGPTGATGGVVAQGELREPKRSW